MMPGLSDIEQMHHTAIPMQEPPSFASALLDFPSQPVPWNHTKQIGGTPKPAVTSSIEQSIGYLEGEIPNGGVFLDFIAGKIDDAGEYESQDKSIDSQIEPFVKKI
uniref:Uncharacterized protein n=1 Tax=Solanum tuberosum TaxID=4113 RepID=M1CEQ7_SOLTU